MTNLSDIINVLPRMKSGDDLIKALKILFIMYKIY